MLTHIPHVMGYWKDRMKIADICLQSMVNNARSSHQELYTYDLVVYDQGSCIEWKTRLRQLRDSGYIDTLIENQHNIGKCHAFHQVFNMLDSKYVVYTDDDVLFYPGWLNTQMDLLKCHDKVGLVTGWPVISRFHHYEKMHDNMTRGGKHKLEKDRIEDHWIELDAMGRGITMEYYLSADESKRDMKTITLKTESDEYTAWAVGHHMQFIAERQAIVDALPPCKLQLMGRMRDLDYALQENGVWSLATYVPTCRHMGNVMDNAIVNECIDMGVVL
jgi:glycosyltransferase involved in cell wall biosynthesis